MRADRRDPIIAALRKHKPTKFEATLRDGTKKQIPLSTKQNRWELLSDTLEVLQWVTIESLDNDGNTLGAIEREGEFDDEQDPEVVRGENFARIIVSAVTAAMSETRKMFADSTRANAEIIRSLVDSQHVVTENFQMAMRIQATALGQVQPEEDNVTKMLQMAMALKMGGSPAITVTPPVKQPSIPVKPNGKGG